MLGLETSDSEKEETNLLYPEEMRDNEEDDDLYNDLLDHLERQHAFQTRLLQQSGAGGLDTPSEPLINKLEQERSTLNSNPLLIVRVVEWGYVNVISLPSLRQRGNLIPGQNITQALQDGLRRAVNQVLTTTPGLDDQDRLYFTISSDRLHNNFQGWGLRAGEWREGGDRLAGPVPTFSSSPQQQRTI